MRSLGLDGVVGAPAIVRTNPLLRKYDERFVPSCERSQQDMNRLVGSFMPFSWRDVLDVIQKRHETGNLALRPFVNLSTALLPDKVLVYDLDTPSLPLSIGAGLSAPPYRLVMLRGSCHILSAGPGVCPIVDGSVGSLFTREGVAIIRKDLKYLSLSELSCCLYAPTGQHDANPVLLASGKIRSALLTTAEVEYRQPSYRGSMHDPDECPDTRELCDLVLSMADDPAALLRSMRYLYDRFHRLDLMFTWRGNDSDDIVARSIPLDPYGEYYRFAPRGASR